MTVELIGSRKTDIVGKNVQFDIVMEELVEDYIRRGQHDIGVYTRVPDRAAVAAFQLCAIKQILIRIDTMIIARLVREKTCTPASCPKMIASDEWHFLCAPHADKPRDCCAIDYMQHTVDSCASLLMLEKPITSPAKQYNSIVRRVFRIFGHLYFHHVEFFKSISDECAKCYLFLKEFGLWKPDMAIIPEEVLHGLTVGKPVTVVQPVPVVDVKSAGTIVDLRTVTMQLSQESEDDCDSRSDHTVIMDS